MGTFNLTCCVTKTPIIEGDWCVILLFKVKAKNDLSDEGDGLRFAFESHFFEIYKGNYEGYGRVSGCPINNLCVSDKYLIYAISNEAWEHGIVISKSDKFKNQSVSIDNTIAANLQFRDAMHFEMSNPSIEKLKELADILYRPNWATFGKEYKIMSALHSFCNSNHFNMFIENNRYGGQSINSKEMREWNKLRNIRIKNLESTIEE